MKQADVCVDIIGVEKQPERPGILGRPVSPRIKSGESDDNGVI
jgi:hypothetical protein